MSEPQYAHYKDIPLASLGLMANEIWRRDPKMMGIHLARYKFVAKMLAEKERVAEIGCGDGFYSNIVVREVARLDLYDFDKTLMPVGASYLDILSPQSPVDIYDAAYSLDVMEHIPQAQEDVYLTNICHLLSELGVFIVGMPSLESQPYASPASKAGHVNCKSSAGLKSLLEKYFHNVFMFGMNDETLHTGFGPMCQYLMGVCCGVR